MSLRIIHFLGESGSGKTTTIELLLKELAGARIGVIKHIHAEGFDISDKDTARFARAGASTVVAISPYETVIILREKRLSLAEVLKYFEEMGTEYLFVEGFKEEVNLLKGAIKVLCVRDEGSALRQIAELGPPYVIVSYSMKEVKAVGNIEVIHMPEETYKLVNILVHKEKGPTS